MGATDLSLARVNFKPIFDEIFKLSTIGAYLKKTEVNKLIAQPLDIKHGLTY